jgi:hypothetical protein
MAGVIVKEGNRSIANIVAFDGNRAIEQDAYSPNSSWKADWKMHLYTSVNYASGLAHDATLTGFVEATFANYESKFIDMSPATDPELESEACTKSTLTLRSDYQVGSSQTVEGWFIVGNKMFSQTNEKVLIAFGSFEAPKEVVNGDVITFTIDYKLCKKISDSRFEMTDAGLMHYLEIVRKYAVEGNLVPSANLKPSIHLYEAETVTDPSLAIESDFDECDFDGYSTQDGTAKVPTLSNNEALIKYTIPPFIRTAGSSGSFSTANGYYVKSSDGTDFIGYSEFAPEDTTDFSTVGEALNMQWRLCFNSDIVESDGDVLPPTEPNPI